LITFGISTVAYSNSWGEGLKIGVVGPYTGEMSKYGMVLLQKMERPYQ
jgi:hypothetical protein